MSFITVLFNKIKGMINEIQIEIDIAPANSASVEVQLEVEAALSLYSYRWDRWFNASEVTPLDTTWGDNEAAITTDGIILFAFECVWSDGVTVSDVEIPSEKAAPVSSLRQILNDGNRDRSFLSYATAGY